jgi:hypothetical protein
MIPGNTIITTAQVGEFTYPTNLPYAKQSQTVMGGVALGDPSQGRLYQTWVIALSGTTITVAPTATGVTALTHTATGADINSTVALAFDSNMAPTICWTTPAGCSLYWYDSSLGAYTTTNYPGVTSCRVAVDDARPFYSSGSDVIFAYTLGGTLYWRQQRDRYAVERTVGATTKKLVRVGLSDKNRLQFELR